ncbi:MAG: LacI family DNA-binding transcriptional regulator [Inquilinus sp.]|nr:LacI family DNA-binding transcriptional regulator [Inquilinus sp.]
MGREIVTSMDVARQAGVSQSAVSRVFTPGASVSGPMREKVMSVARELGYRPNVLARSLITGRSRIIGLVVSYLDNQYYPVALEKLSHALQECGYHVLIFMAGPTSGDFETVLEEILGYQVDGIVMASVSMSSDLTYRCADEGIPVVLFNRTQDEGRFSAVTSDNEAGGRKLAEFLVAGGHRRIGYIAGWEGASTQRDREAGFRAGLAAAGRELHAREVGSYDFEQAKIAARRMFAAADPPDAVFIANDHMAIAAMDVMRYELGLKIPEGVSVVAYDDVPMAAWPSYDLTTVRQPTNRMVEAVVEALLAGIEKGDTKPRRVSFAGPLMIRGSARKPQEDHR